MYSLKYLWEDRKVYKANQVFLFMLRIKKLNATLGKKVYVDTGDFFGEVEEAILSENKIDSWRMRVSREMVSQLNGARGVIIPHQFVKAVGDIFIVNKASLPIMDGAFEETVSEEETMDLSEEPLDVGSVALE
jgi:sporulation protein YlmC with PRC-barrel domain